MIPRLGNQGPSMDATSAALPTDPGRCQPRLADAGASGAASRSRALGSRRELARRTPAGGDDKPSGSPSRAASSIERRLNLRSATWPASDRGLLSDIAGATPLRGARANVDPGWATTATVEGTFVSFAYVRETFTVESHDVMV
ncbi:hypothetical protein MRX96_024352 [Rhipicephalus microplus]